MQSRRKTTLGSRALLVQPLLSAIGGGVALVLVFLLALVYSATCLGPEFVGEPLVAVPGKPLLPLCQRRMVPRVPELLVIPAMRVPGGAALVSHEQAMQEMDGPVETPSPSDVDFPLLQMELLGDLDAGLPASLLWGTFYDLTRSRGGVPSGLLGGKEQQSVVKNCLNSNDWRGMSRFWRLPSVLYGSCFLYPVEDIALLPEMFSWPSGSLPLAWMAAYSGRVVSPVSGTSRFVGTGNAYLAVRFNSRPVLESGSCLISGWRDANSRKSAAGAAIKVKEGEIYSVCIILAGSGNVADFGLLWEHVSGETADGKERLSTDARYYLFRTNLCTPVTGGSDETQGTCGKGPVFEPDSPVWRVIH